MLILNINHQFSNPINSYFYIIAIIHWRNENYVVQISVCVLVMLEGENLFTTDKKKSFWIKTLFSF